MPRRPALPSRLHGTSSVSPSVSSLRTTCSWISNRRSSAPRPARAPEGAPEPRPGCRCRSGMKRLLLLAAALGAALLLPTLAAAKGPDRASISGPGLSHPVTIEGDGESGSSALGVLAGEGGFFAQMYGATGPGTLRARPKLKLGPRYQVTYRVPGQDGASTVQQDLYPYAA